MTKTFAERCHIAQKFLPDAQYKAMLTALHAEMLAALAEQPAPAAQQEPVAYGMWDTMLGKDNRMMMVRLDKGQDGCTVPLYTTPQAQRKPLTDEEIRDIHWSRPMDEYAFARAIEAKLKENT